MANYYVAPIPSHGAGTLANPWGIPDLLTGPGGAVGPPTRGVALNTPVAGDTLYWRGGNYHFTGSSINGDNTRQLLGPSNSGTATQPITFRAYPGETVHIFEDTGTQPVMGTELPTVNYVRFLGLTVHMTPNDFHGPGFRISGTGNEIGYCEVVGTYVPSTDNHDAIRLDYSTNSWIHHNNLHDVQGDHHNSVGIKMYHNVTPLIEDNYIHSCFAAIYDKNGDSGTGNYKEQSTYRRNWLTNCSYPVFVGNDDGAGNTANYFIYDNVFDANTNNTLAAIRLNDINTAPAGRCQIYNNLFRNLVTGQAVMSGYQTTEQNVWNNIVLSGGAAVMGYYEYYTVFTPSGPSAPLAYMDYNVYEIAPSSYKFGQFSTPSSFTLAQFQAQGFETHAYRNPAANIFVDQTSYVLKGIYPTAGRYGDMVGPRSMSPVGPTNINQPNSVAQIINSARYGPAAMPGLDNPGYISETGLLVIYSRDTGEFKPFTAISSNPSFFKNGSGTPMAVTGPFWRDLKKDSPVAFYRPNTDLLVTDSVTMTTVAGWAISSSGSLPAVTLQALPNKLGQLEPSMGSFGGIAYPGFDSTDWTMPLGINVTHGGASLGFSLYYPFSNALHRATAGSAAITTDANGNPLSISSKVSFQAFQPSSLGVSDSRGCPLLMGTYRFIADESAPSTPMVVTLAPAGIGPTHVTVSAPTITGTGIGKMWEWDVSYKLANPASFVANLTLSFDKPVGGSFPCPWTLGTDFRFQFPNNPTRPVSNLAIDENFRAWLTTPSGKVPAYVRWVDTVIGSDGISTQVDPGDMLNPLAPFWNPKTTTVNITAIQNFDPTRSPYTFWSQHWSGASTPGGGPPGAPYGLPTNAGMLNFTGASMPNGWVMAECEYDNSTYQLKSFQTVGLSGLPAVTCTNGSLPNVTISFNGAFPTIFLTAPNRFVFAWSPSGTHPTNTTGMAGFINTLTGRTGCTGTASLQVPDVGSTGYAGSAHVTGQLGSGYHMNIPAGATDAFVSAASALVFANYPSGGSVLVEYSNELWSFIGSMLGVFLLGSCHAMSAVYTTRAQNAVLRARQVHDLVVAAAAAAGWTGTIVRSFGSQWGNPGETSSIINFVNTYNAANPGSPIQVDAVHVADYEPFNQITDTTLVAACASVYAQNASSTQFGNPNPFTRRQWWDIYAHIIKYYTITNGPASVAASLTTALRNYVPVGSQPAGYVPLKIGYEGGLQNVYTGGVSSDNAMKSQLTHDLQYDPECYKFDLANYQSWQFAGFSHVNIYGLSLVRVGSNVWGIYNWQGQQPGPGDGTVDGVTNQFFADTGQSQDYTNQSVRGYMQRRWMDVANTTTTAPTTPTGAITLHALTASGTGTFVGSSVGSGAITLRALTRAGTGTFANSSIGSGSIVLRSLVTAGAGTFTPTATFGEVTLGSLTVAGVGAVSVAGVITLGSLTVAGSGTIASSTTGAVTLDGLTPDGTGEFTTEMDSTVTLGQLAVSGVGTVSPHRLPAAVRWFPNLSRT